MANPFTYPAWDLVTMTELDSLPYSGVSFGQAVNSPGSWSGTLNLADPRISTVAYLDSSRTGRTLLCVDLDGVVVWGGIVWTRRYNEVSKQMSVGAAEIGSYFQSRIQAFDYTSTWNTVAADPMVIASQVVQDAQGVSGGSIAGGITFKINPIGGTPSADWVTVSYPGTQLQTIESIVSGLASMGYTLGFDYSFDVAYLPGTTTPAVTLNFWYPRQGRAYSQSQIVVTGKDCIDWNYDEDSTKQASTIWESGGGSSTPSEISTVIPGYPLLEANINHSQVNDESQLVNMAVNDLGLLCYPITTPNLILPVPLPDPITGVVDSSRLGFGQFGLGDDLLFKIDPVAGDGENVSPRFPNGLSFEWRITNWTCAVPDKGVPTLTFDLNTPPVATIPPMQPPLN